ncbi:hypothetical protein [Leptospirillum ferriphilum]|uniref:hypothetical protein n=1 Tax=Leptospirillum ferriphilum TaxID=178606 RepID=UPI0011D17F89|nr:hypothetical protein [Leptospirillum ferriphilum]
MSYHPPLRKNQESFTVLKVPSCRGQTGEASVCSPAFSTRTEAFGLVGKTDDPQARVMMEDRLDGGCLVVRENGSGRWEEPDLWWSRAPGTGRSVMKRTFPPDFLPLRGKKASQ